MATFTFRTGQLVTFNPVTCPEGMKVLVANAQREHGDGPFRVIQTEDIPELWRKDSKHHQRLRITDLENLPVGNPWSGAFFKPSE